MATTLPLYHAQIGPLTGLVFPIGDDLYFTTVDDTRVYHVSQLPALTLHDAVPEGMAEHLVQTVLAPRLQAQGGEQ